MKERSYTNQIEEYDSRAIESWKVADMLKKELEDCDSLDRWNGYGEGYTDLRATVSRAIERLRKIY